MIASKRKSVITVAATKQAETQQAIAKPTSLTNEKNAQRAVEYLEFREAKKISNYTPEQREEYDIKQAIKQEKKDDKFLIYKLKVKVAQLTELLELEIALNASLEGKDIKRKDPPPIECSFDEKGDEIRCGWDQWWYDFINRYKAMGYFDLNGKPLKSYSGLLCMSSKMNPASEFMAIVSNMIADHKEDVKEYMNYNNDSEYYKLSSQYILSSYGNLFRSIRDIRKMDKYFYKPDKPVIVKSGELVTTHKNGFNPYYDPKFQPDTPKKFMYKRKLKIKRYNKAIDAENNALMESDGTPSIPSDEYYDKMINDIDDPYYDTDWTLDGSTGVRSGIVERYNNIIPNNDVIPKNPYYNRVDMTEEEKHIEEMYQEEELISQKEFLESEEFANSYQEYINSNENYKENVKLSKEKVLSILMDKKNDALYNNDIYKTLSETAKSKLKQIFKRSRMDDASASTYNSYLDVLMKHADDIGFNLNQYLINVNVGDLVKANADPNNFGDALMEVKVSPDGHEIFETLGDDPHEKLRYIMKNANIVNYNAYLGAIIQYANNIGMDLDTFVTAIYDADYFSQISRDPKTFVSMLPSVNLYGGAPVVNNSGIINTLATIPGQVVTQFTDALAGLIPSLNTTLIPSQPIDETPNWDVNQIKKEIIKIISDNKLFDNFKADDGKKFNEAIFKLAGIIRAAGLASYNYEWYVIELNKYYEFLKEQSLQIGDLSDLIINIDETEMIECSKVINGFPGNLDNTKYLQNLYTQQSSQTNSVVPQPSQSNGVVVTSNFINSLSTINQTGVAQSPSLSIKSTQPTQPATQSTTQPVSFTTNLINSFPILGQFVTSDDKKSSSANKPTNELFNEISPENQALLAQSSKAHANFYAVVDGIQGQSGSGITDINAYIDEYKKYAESINLDIITFLTYLDVHDAQGPGSNPQPFFNNIAVIAESYNFDSVKEYYESLKAHDIANQNA